MLLKAKDSWIQKFGHDREINPLCRPLFRQPPLIPLTSNIDFARDLQLEGEDPQGPIPVVSKAKEYFDIDFASFLEFTKQIDGPSVWHICDWERNTDVSDGIEIPDSLLQGPWTEDKIKYLFWLVKSGAEVDWVTSTSGEV
jgi:hypothetical protein